MSKVTRYIITLGFTLLNPVISPKVSKNVDALLKHPYGSVSVDTLSDRSGDVTDLETGEEEEPLARPLGYFSLPI